MRYPKGKHPNCLKNLGPSNGFKKGYKPTDEHLRKLSESHMGHVPWNKGKKMPESVIIALKNRKGSKVIWSEDRKNRFKERMSGERNPRWVTDRNQYIGEITIGAKLEVLTVSQQYRLTTF